MSSPCPRVFIILRVHVCVCVCVCVCVGHCNRKLSMPQSPLKLVKKESATSLSRTKIKCVMRQMREHNERFLQQRCHSCLSVSRDLVERVPSRIIKLNTFLRSKYRYMPHNKVSVNDGAHILRYSHNIIILTTVLQSPTVFSTVTCCTGL